MGNLHPHIDAPIRTFIENQHLFFVATAPSGEDGHVNCSPKGLDTFRILGPNEVAYLDYVGSGVETIAHLRQNGRIVIMFCALTGPPKIVRLHGTGTVVEPHDDGFARLAESFGNPNDPSVRSIIRIDVTRVGDSCGYAVPRFTYEGERDTLARWSDKKGPEGLRKYQETKNAASVDGLEGLRWVKP